MQTEYKMFLHFICILMSLWTQENIIASSLLPSLFARYTA